jgi:hypothetical protein
MEKPNACKRIQRFRCSFPEEPCGFKVSYRGAPRGYCGHRLMGGDCGNLAAVDAAIADAERKSREDDHE